LNKVIIWANGSWGGSIPPTPTYKTKGKTMNLFEKLLIISIMTAFTTALIIGCAVLIVVIFG